MTPKEFTQWLDRLYATKEDEIDCDQLQAFLPAYVEAEAEGSPAPSFAADVTQHLGHCPDCREIYQGLLTILEAESDILGTPATAGETETDDLAGQTAPTVPAYSPAATS